MNTRGWITASCLIAAALVASCGGNKFYSNQGGEVESGELILDSLPARPPETDYVIGQGDQLDVLFPFNREWNLTDVKVRPDGKISLPYIGEITVAGSTVARTDSVLKHRYGSVFRDPSVNVILREFQNPVIYLLGNVKNAGGYPFTRGMTLMQGLASAQGFDDDAKKNGVVIMRRVAPDRIIGIEVDVKQLIDDHRYDFDVPLEPFDIVYVPKSRLKSAADFSSTLYEVLGRPMDLYIKGWDVAKVKVMYEYYRRARAIM